MVQPIVRSHHSHPSHQFNSGCAADMSCVLVWFCLECYLQAAPVWGAGLGLAVRQHGTAHRGKDYRKLLISDSLLA